jgi:hypothetical protein
VDTILSSLFPLFIALLIYILNRSGDGPYPCLTTLLILLALRFVHRCSLCISLNFDV